jgi:hypothetical protein
LRPNLRQCGSVRIVSAVRHGQFRPFPWRSLESTSRRESAALRDAYRWAKSHVRLAPFALAVQELVGAKVELLVLRARPLSDARAPDGGVGFVVGRADALAAAGVLVEVEAALAATVVARAIRRAPPIISSSATTVSPDIAGGLAAVVMAAVRRAHQGEALRVYSAGPACELEADFARVNPDLVAVSLTVLLADDGGLVRAGRNASIHPHRGVRDARHRRRRGGAAPWRRVPSRNMAAAARGGRGPRQQGGVGRAGLAVGAVLGARRSRVARRGGSTRARWRGPSVVPRGGGHG